MTDPLDDLKSELTVATPAPDAQRRAENIALAQKNFAALQGSAPQARPKSTSLWTRTKHMFDTLTSRAALTATTAIVACGFLIATPFGQDLLRTPQDVVFVPQELETNQTEVAPTAPEIVPSPRPDLRVEGLTDAAEDMVPGLLAGQPQAAVAETAPMMIAEAEEAAGHVARPSAQSRAAPSADSYPLPAPVIPAPAEDILGFSLGQSLDTEAYANATPNPLKITAEDPVSTFSIDVDTAAYALVRQSLTSGRMPPRDAVRIEELINYFPYDHPAPDGPHPFEPTVSVFDTPWNPDTQLVHIGIQGELPAIEDRPPLNLVFLIDTSGSMNQPNKLPLLRQSFMLMLDNLNPEDEVAIVTYAGSSTVALEPTTAANRDTIRAALTALTAGGSTNGEGGLKAAYALAEQMTDEGDVSRVILATDGDFNVGLSDPRGLESYIEDKRDSGTYLSVLGFGRGNLQDATMQTLAQNGNGTAAYIDTLSEAQKVLVDQLTGALYPIANDVKIQVEFNPSTVAEYRLIGYETRSLNREDFNNDAVDAGELGAGHTVTAIYEITPTGSPAQLSDPLRYQPAQTAATSDELGFLRLRYKTPGDDTSQLIETPFQTVTQPTPDAAFAAAIAGFGQLLRDDTYLGDWSYADAIDLANANRGDDPFGYRTEAVQLLRLAQSLAN